MSEAIVLEEGRGRPATKARIADSIRTRPLSLCVLAALAVISWLPRMEGPLDLRWDGGAYYVLGTSLAEGKGYRLLNEPGEIEAVQYPPLLPAIVAAHQLVLGTSDPTVVGKWLRLSFFVIYVGYVFGAYALLRTFLPEPYALGAALVVILNLFTHFLSDLCFAELPFALISTLFVLANRKPGLLPQLLASVCAVAAYLLRTIGIALFVAWIGEALLTRRFRTAAFRMVVAALPVFAWHAYIHAVESSPSYTHPAYAYQRAEYLFYNVSYSKNMSLRDPFTPERGHISAQELLQRFVENLVRMPFSVGEGVSARIGYWEYYLAAVLEPTGLRGIWRVWTYGPPLLLGLLGLTVMAGLFLLARDGEKLIPLYVLLVLAALCLIPWPVQWPRYWAPVVPFLALGLYRAAMARPMDYESRGAKLWRILAHLFVGLTLVFQVLALYTAYTRQIDKAEYRDRNGQLVSSRLFFYKEDGYSELDAALDWLRSHARGDEVIAASMPHWAYIRTGLKSVMPPFEQDRDKMQALLDSVPVSYVVVDGTPINFTRRYTLALLKEDPHRWRQVYSIVGGSSDPDRFVEIYQRVGR